ncbi:hypothetical protein MMPV_007265 [Pyropia vietnamensis]
MACRGATRAALCCVIAVAAVVLLVVTGVKGQVEEDPSCKNQTDDGINEETLSVDCPTGVPASTPSPLDEEGQRPGATERDTYGGDYLFLRKPPTLLRDGVLSICPATASVSSESWTFHGTVNPETGKPAEPDSRDVYWTFPPAALRLNGAACTAAGGGNVTVYGYYDTAGEPEVGLEGFGEATSLNCGIFRDMNLQWLADFRRRIVRLFVQLSPPSPTNDWSCSLNPGYFECVLWRPLCEGGSLNFTGISFEV